MALDSSGVANKVNFTFTDPTNDKDGRVKMGKSKCDDGEKHTERDLKNMKKESKCQKKVL